MTVANELVRSVIIKLFIPFYIDVHIDVLSERDRCIWGVLMIASLEHCTDFEKEKYSLSWFILRDMSIFNFQLSLDHDKII